MPATDAPAAAEERLSIDQAVEMLTPRDGEDRPEAESSAEAAEPSEGAGAEPAAEDAALDPPHFWSAEDKAAFEELPRHLQETVLSYEKNRDAAAARAIQAAAEARNRAERTASGADEVIARLDKLIPEAEAAFGQKWPATPDWAALADEVGADQAMRLKLQHDQEAEGLQRLRAAKQEAAAVEHQAYVAGEFEKLKTVEPELADPKHGAERRRDVARFLSDNGVPLEQIGRAGAIEFALAYDAMRYRQARAAYADGARPSTQARPTLSPGAGAARGSSQQRQAGAKTRFAQKPTVDNAVAAILARG